MKRSSIFYTITFIFILATTSLCLAFLWLKAYDQENYTKELNGKYSIVSRLALLHMNKLISDEEYSLQMKDFNIPTIEDNKKKEDIIKNAKVLQEISIDIGSAAILVLDKRHFLKIIHADEVMLLEDVEYQPYRYQIITAIFSIVLLIVVGSYIFIYKKLKPLRRLKREITKFASGNLDIEKVSSGNDEISEIGEAFYMAVTQVRKFGESRQLFLRNIMHELKTPITKGRICVEMIEEGRQKQRLVGVFERLENLINEFAAVEGVASGVWINDISTHTIKELILEAIDLAMVDKSKVEIELEFNFILNVDFKLFCIAIKNMIDNAIKYSSDQRLLIKTTKDSLLFCSTGEKLEKELQFYTEAFTKGSKAKNSFGLGLYIVDNIIKSHNLELEYQYKNNTNIFKFTNLDKIRSIMN